MANNDNRVMCKYGVDCYQKNPEHHKKYKHPKKIATEQFNNITKKRKLNDIHQTDEYKKKAANEKCENLMGESSGIGVVHENDISPEMKKTEFPPENLPTTIHERLKFVFLVEMPNDFFSFYDFCKSLDGKKPHCALAAVGIYLVGPFDLFDKELRNFTPDEGVRHYRYFYDPPEFQTVFTCNDKKQLHYGYFRDDPKDMPAFVASNEANTSCVIDIVSDNLFSAVNYHIEKVKTNADPFKKMKIQKIQQALVEWSKKHNFTLQKVTKRMRDRSKNVVTKTFHGAGLVVPYNKTTELGYRELKENDKSLKAILENLSKSESEEERKVYWTKLQPVITYASIANDEFDFGTSLELGIDLFCFGDPILHKTILRILPTSYDLLGRTQFSQIICAHLEKRTKDGNVNTITFS